MFLILNSWICCHRKEIKMDWKERHSILPLTKPYVQGLFRRKSNMSEVFSLNVANFKMLLSVTPSCAWLWLAHVFISVTVSGFYSVCGTIGFQDLLFYRHRWVSLLLIMNTEKGKERRVTGENEDINMNTLYQQYIVEKKDEEVCMKLPS